MWAIGIDDIVKRNDKVCICFEAIRFETVRAGLFNKIIGISSSFIRLLLATFSGELSFQSGFHE
jgi:hypothetical protein